MALFAGLFAMHGLGSHGPNAVHSTPADTPLPLDMPSAVPSAVTSAMSAARPAAAPDTHAAMQTASVVHTLDGASAALSPEMAGATKSAVTAVAAVWADGELSGSGGLASLCFAVLTALAVWVLSLARTVRTAALAPLAARLAVASAGGQRADPPSRVALSVHRC